MINYFNWTEIFALNSNNIYVNSIISWEDASQLVIFDVSAPVSFIFESFSKNFFSLSNVSLTSFLDFIMTSQALSLDISFINYFYADLALFLSISFTEWTLLFSSEAGDLTNACLDTNPEVLTIVLDAFSVVNLLAVSNLVNFYDIFFFTPANSLLDHCVFIWWLFLTLFALLNFTTLTSYFSFARAPFNGFFFTRTLYLLNNFSFENRLQFDWSVIFVLFIFFIWISLLMTYDDTNIELVELMHFFIISFFIIVIFYLIAKYSTHYFAFLENSVSDGFSTSYIAKQFVRDVSNTFALFLRFFLLIFRLNIYDGLDDFLDSYYIFFIDFDEDSYFDELFYFSDFFYYFSDNREDVLVYQTVEFDWWGDLYSKYFIIFGKFFYFWAFILEEAFRVTLAIYISYLIIFEVHAVNVSFREETFFTHKKL